MSALLTVAAARLLRSDQVCLALPGLPLAAARLARATHAPGLTIVEADGRVDGVLAGLAELHAWLQTGRVDVGVLTAAQVDLLGNLGDTVLGEYDDPTARLAGAGLSAAVAAHARETVVVLPHRLHSFVDRVDFVTAVGFGTGPVDRAALGLPGGGPLAVVTDLGVLRPDPATAELVLTDLHPGVTVEQVRAETGWELEVAEDPVTTAEITAAEHEASRSSA
ncbi:CoA-transferase subunit beta [Pseudonocardia ailaonensis]|uniref:CoA-transferase subunit beta n=1 Tax=Pseudonocardia ailaonensis TaxID=367279 RepID=A0ABN2N869_9PSEU